jgi:hypothetical protein
MFYWINLFILFFETRSQYIAQVGLELTIFLLQSCNAGITDVYTTSDLNLFLIDTYIKIIHIVRVTCSVSIHVHIV